MKLASAMLKLALATDNTATTGPSSFPDVGPAGPGGGPPGAGNDKAMAAPKMTDTAFPVPNDYSRL